QARAVAFRQGGGRMVRSRARSQARQNMHTDPSSRDPHCVQHGGQPLSLPTICLALIFMGNDEGDTAPYLVKTTLSMALLNSYDLANLANSGLTAQRVNIRVDAWR